MAVEPWIAAVPAPRGAFWEAGAERGWPHRLLLVWYGVDTDDDRAPLAPVGAHLWEALARLGLTDLALPDPEWAAEGLPGAERAGAFGRILRVGARADWLALFDLEGPDLWYARQCLFAAAPGVPADLRAPETELWMQTLAPVGTALEAPARLPFGVALAITAGIDGECALVAAPGAEGLREFLDAMRQAGAAAGVPVRICQEEDLVAPETWARYGPKEDLGGSG
ncbi:MAG: hypothetical protein AAFR17_13870 [Pseudomonadota bacterium]